MIRTLSLLLGGILLTADTSRGQDAHTIKTRGAAVGDTVLVQKTETTNNRTVVTDPAEKQIFQTVETITTEHVIYKETVLARDGNAPPTRLRREYEKAQIQSPGIFADLACSGKTVLIEKQNGKYHFRFENAKELTEEEARYLDKEFNRGADPLDFEKLLLPRTPVRLNEEWRIDMATVAREFGGDGEMEIDSGRATGTGLLKKVYQNGQRPFGELSFRMEMPIKSMGKALNRMAMEDGSKITLNVGLDLCIDGQVESDALTGTMKLNAKAKVTLPNGQPGKATVSLEVQSQELHRSVLK